MPTTIKRVLLPIINWNKQSKTQQQSSKVLLPNIETSKPRYQQQSNKCYHWLLKEESQATKDNQTSIITDLKEESQATKDNQTSMIIFPIGDLLSVQTKEPRNQQ